MPSRRAALDGPDVPNGTHAPDATDGPPGAERLALSVHAEVAERGVRLDLDLSVGRVLALVGPNGAGKSTAIALLTGTLRPSSGTVAIDGQLVSGPGVFVPSHRRQLALLEQRPLLFEHLDVAANVEFGLRARGVDAVASRRRAQAELAQVGCADLAAKRSWQVSGGQAQRIALARALAVDPRLLLLDEPFAALDVVAAPALRTLLVRRLRGERRSAVIVTHDILDVLMLPTDVAVIEDGSVVEAGEVSALLARPRSRFLADLAGLNVVRGRFATTPTPSNDVHPGQVGGIDVGGQMLTGLLDAIPTQHAPSLAVFTPDAVGVHRQAPTGSPRTVLPARVTAIEPRGALVRVTSTVPSPYPHRDATIHAHVTAAAAADLGLVPGLDVWLSVKATQVRIYPN